MDEVAMETEVAEMREARAEDVVLRAGEPLAPAEEEEEQEAKPEPPEPKGSLAKRFAARRAQRRGGKKGGSLSERLRGLVAEAPESRS
jgi:hypothetical protein